MINFKKEISEDIPCIIYVECYSGYRANERPVRFSWKDKTYNVINIIDRWYGIEHDYFKVLADDGRVYLIRWNRYEDFWSLIKVMDRSRMH